MPLSTDEVVQRRDYAASLKEYVDQRDWYSSRAGKLKTGAQRSDLVVIGAGAVVAAIPAVASGLTWGTYLVSGLGILIAVTQGAQRVWRSAEIWPGYRQASERMKGEYRMFIFGNGPYAADFDAACALYLERLEAILAHEQEGYFEDIRS